MKKTDLEKHKGLKIAGKLAQSGTPTRFGAASTAPPDRRERRRLDQAAGLVPFATKLPSDLVTALNERAQERGLSAAELLAQILRTSL